MGWVRIVEASVAILLILGVLIALNLNKSTDVNSDLSQKIPPLLEEIAANVTLRDSIINDPVDKAEQNITSFLRQRIKNPSLNFSVKVCDINDTFCPLGKYPSQEVFVRDRVISSTLESYSPKRVKIFLWVN